MSETVSRFSEIVVRVVPAAHDAASRHAKRAGGEERLRRYHVLVYSDIAALRKEVKPPPGQSTELARLPLAMVEDIRIHWGRYEEYLATFLMGDKLVEHMRYRLLETMSPDLERLFAGKPPAPGRVRMWWCNESPELEDLPWELLLHGRVVAPDGDFRLVRGLPPDPAPPLVPIHGPLRLAVLHDPANPHADLIQALTSLLEVEVIPLTGPPREALKQVVDEQFELLHIIADGIVSLACDGVLWTHDRRRPELPSSEVSALLRGSNVSVLGLSAPESVSPDTVLIAGRQVPSAFRAFAYFGSAELPLPSVVAPLGPVQDQHLRHFWHRFYTALNDTFSLEQAIADACAAGPPLPMALFLRHAHGRLFRRVRTTRSGATAPVAAPSNLEAELQASQSLVAKLEALQTEFGAMPSSVNDFLQAEGAHQQRISAELEPWTRLEAGE